MTFLRIVTAACICIATCACTAPAVQIAPQQEIGEADPSDVITNSSWAAPGWDHVLTDLNRGELLRINGHYASSTAAFAMADSRLLAREGSHSTTLTDQAEKPDYRPAEFERLMLTNRLAMNYIATGQWDLALVNLQRTHAREKVIEENHATRGRIPLKFALGSTAILGPGYPFETFNNRAVAGLANGHQTALSHYTAGFLLEAQGSPLLAAQTYRTAMDMRPQTEVLQRGFLGLKERAFFADKTARGEWTDVLFVVESGSVAPRTLRNLSAVAAMPGGSVKVSFTYPAILPNPSVMGLQLRIDERWQPLQEIANFTNLGRRALRDEMPFTVSSAVSQALAENEERELRKKTVTASGSGVTLVATTSAFKTEMRAWLTLPEHVYLSRRNLPRGIHQIALGESLTTFTINIDAPFAVIQLRQHGNRVFLGSVSPWSPAANLTGTRNVAPLVPKPFTSKKKHIKR